MKPNHYESLLKKQAAEIEELKKLLERRRIELLGEMVNNTQLHAKCKALETQLYEKETSQDVLGEKP